MSYVVYSKENCPFCSKIKKVLELTDSQFVVYTLNEDFSKDEFYSIFGNGSTFPQVMYEDTKIGGCVETIKYLKEQQIIKS